jgi:hypothetical protein
MAFSFYNLPVSRQRFKYMEQALSMNISDTLSFSCAFELIDIRVHMSAVHPSAEYLRVYLSHPDGAEYGLKIISQIMNASTEVWWQPQTSRAFILPSGAGIFFSMLCSVTATNYGIIVSGWAITEEA